jgi:hypothetical protein
MAIKTSVSNPYSEPTYIECEKNLPTIEEESDEKIIILVDSIENSFDEAIKNQKGDSLNIEDYRLEQTSKLKILSYEKWTLIIGGSISALIIVIGFIVGFFMWLAIYLGHNMGKPELESLQKTNSTNIELIF